MIINHIIEFLKENGIKYCTDLKRDVEINGFCPLNSLSEGCITWARDVKNVCVDELNKLNAILLVAEYGQQITDNAFSILYVENAHRTFFRLVGHFFCENDPEVRKPQIASTAVIETKCIGKDLYVGHHTYIGPDVVIGNNVEILNNVTIQGRVEIGDYTVIESGTTIGACGFGHYNDEQGNPICVPHFGGVRIGKHVKIGANNAISRGCLADTVIDDYVKTDNLCHIAHNDHIGYGTMLTANTVISGSVDVGKNVWMAPGSLLNNGIMVGDSAFLGLGCAATKDVPANKVVVGVPAKVLRDR